MQVRPSFAVLAATIELLAIFYQASAQGYPNPRYPIQPAAQAIVDPPGRVARISYAQGNVSLEPAGFDVFSDAELNYPLTAGDRVYVDLQATAELQTAGLALRLANGADITLTSLTDSVAQFGLVQGSLRLRTHNLSAADGRAGIVEVDTPNGSIVVQIAGDIRIDSYPQTDTTVVSVTTGEVVVSGPNLNRVVGVGQSFELFGDPTTTRFLRMLPLDNLDAFDQQRESVYLDSIAAQGQYINPETIGAEDLAQYGSWSSNPDYGAVWFPRSVAIDWVPYHNGRWAWISPWGWTWIETEPWGFAPFHYGRWAYFNDRWGWIPGPPSLFYGRTSRPFYSPALVVFVGSVDFYTSLGYGGEPGDGLCAWFPLGPSERYVPWYFGSPAYIGRVNQGGSYNRIPRGLHGPERVGDGLPTRTPVYVNRTLATTVVTQRDFSEGRTVERAEHINFNPNTRARLNEAPVLQHPTVSPAVSTDVPHAPARAIPPSINRPVVSSQQGSGKPYTPAYGGPVRAADSQPTDTQTGNPNGYTPAYGGPARQTSQPERQPDTAKPAYPRRRDNQPATGDLPGQPNVPNAVRPGVPAIVSQPMQQQPQQNPANNSQREIHRDENRTPINRTEPQPDRTPRPSPSPPPAPQRHSEPQPQRQQPATTPGKPQ